MRGLLLIRMLLYVSLIFIIALPYNAQAQERKDKIEAAFLYNFLKYITWPESAMPSAESSVNMCIYNNNALVEALKYIQQQKTSERQFTVTSLESMDIPPRCHMVFISSSGPLATNIEQFPQATYGQLFVSDIPDFIEKGGMIGLVKERERIALEINNTALMKSGFKASSRLLGIARRVT